MNDEEKKKIVSEPPPPTDEIDGEWGDDDQTLIRDVPEAVTRSQPAPPAPAVSQTAVAPISAPPKAAEASTPSKLKAVSPVTAPRDEQDDEEDDEEDEDESEASDNEDDEEAEETDADGEDEADAHHAAPAPAPANDWIPDWAPYAVLALLVSASILLGLGLVGGGSASASEGEAAEPATEVAKPAKPSQHP